jgi:HEAT repeat protein
MLLAGVRGAGEDPDKYVRLAAQRVLQGAGDEIASDDREGRHASDGSLNADAVPELLAALVSQPSEYSSEFRTVEAIKAIGKAAVEPLIRFLCDEMGNEGSAHARFVTMGILEYFADEVCRTDHSRWSAIVSTLAGSTLDAPEYVRIRATQVLAKLRDPGTIDLMLRLLEASDMATPSAGRAYEYWGVRCRAASALGNMRYGPAVDLLVSALGELDVPLRFFAAEALEKIGDARAAPALRSSLYDFDGRVVAHAAEALGAIADIESIPRLVELTRDRRRDWGAAVRGSATQALGQVVGRVSDVQVVRQIATAVRERTRDEAHHISGYNVDLIAYHALEQIGHQLSTL